jgi:hypothetical protein|uniref:Uncharacterized protein n=1 Tax=Picea glauca TaxID=3330 RepID=A0A101LV37_PICGL|nr:hypothetical protein ABT39_MTgene2239 [Picea glauca]
MEEAGRASPQILKLWREILLFDGWGKSDYSPYGWGKQLFSASWLAAGWMASRQANPVPSCFSKVPSDYYTAHSAIPQISRRRIVTALGQS